MSATYLWHITLNTGHGRRSPRGEASQIAVDAVGVELLRALRDGETDILLGDLTIGAPHYRLKASTVGPALLCTVLSPERAPLVTFGVAPRPRSSAKLWSILHEHAVSPATDPASPPETPWLAVRVEPSIATDPGAIQWLADYERVVAWAWIERRHADA